MDNQNNNKGGLVNISKNILEGKIGPDEEVKKICIKNWDFNNDGKFTKDEAKRVTNLNKAFFLNTKIKDLNVLSFFENLKELNRNEFYYCRSLEQITLPLGLKTIGDSAFVKCKYYVSKGYKN